MITFSLLFFAVVITGLVCLAIGYRAGFSAGHDIGWDAAEDYVAWHQNIPFQKTAGPDTAAPAAQSEPVELTIHPSWVKQKAES